MKDLGVSVLVDLDNFISWLDFALQNNATTILQLQKIVRICNARSKLNANKIYEKRICEN